MRKIFLLIFSIVFITASGCKEQLVGEDPVNTYEQNLESLWKGFDSNYSYFEHKNINWDSLYTVYHANLDTVQTNRGLFNHMSSLLDNLKDGHATISTPFGTYLYDTLDFTLYDDVLIYFRYLENPTRPSKDSPFVESTTFNDISYLHINTFQGSNSLFKEIDQILERAYSKKALIIDLRTNGGGSDFNSRTVMSRFADKKRLIRKIRYRNGPNHSDFSPLILDNIEPSGFYFDKPVVVLTDRSVFSSAEDFVLGMRQFPNVTIIGEYTGGGSGNPVTYDLPNGWLYSVSRWQILQPENDLLYEGLGLQPDSLVIQTLSDISLRIDSKINAAISLILSQE